jgi:uncharacterized protein YkwD
VPCWISTPEKQLPETGGYRQIILIPKKLLAPATTYTVTMSAQVNGSAWSERWDFTTTDPAAYHERVRAHLLGRVNEVRKLAGLPAVTLDASLSKGCQSHADYVALNVDNPKVKGLGVHDEVPSLPGATPEGAKAGEAAVIAVISDPTDSVDGWMATLYHRIPLLDPRLERIGYGQAIHPVRGWVTVLDATRGR